MFLGGGGGGDGSFPGWDHPDESLGLSQVQHRLLTSPLPRGSGITQPWSQDGICPSLLSPAACSVRAWHRATEPEREGGSTCLSVAVSFPSRLNRHSSLPAPHTASAPELSISFPQGEQPSHHPGCLVGIRGAASKRHLGTVPAGLAGSRSGRFESAVMDCLEYRSRCSQKGPGEDHLTGMWVTQQEGKGWEPDSPGPAGPRGGGQVVLPGRLSRGKRSCRRLKDK